MRVNMTARWVERVTCDPDKQQQDFSDEQCRGLTLRVGRGGAKTWRHGKKTIGRWPVLSLAEARLEVVKTKASATTYAATATVQDLAEEFIGYQRERIKMWKYDEGRVRLHIVPALGPNTRASHVKPADVFRMAEAIERDGSPTQARKCISTARGMFRRGVALGWCDFNPAVDVRLERRPRSRCRYSDPDELAAIWNATIEEERQGLAEENYTRVRTAIRHRLRICTLCRESEVRHMRDQDIQGNWWHLPGHAEATLSDGTVYQWGTKNARSHGVWLGDLAMQEVEKLRRFALPDTDWLSPNLNDRRKPASRDMSEAQRIRARVPQLSDWRPHDHRRTGSTILDRLGVPTDTRSMMLNHRRVGSAITETVYTVRNVEDPRVAEGFKLWDEFLQGVVSGEVADVLEFSGRA